MSLNIATLIQATAEAKRLSRGGLVLSIMLTDEGFVVLGAKDGRHAGRDIAWLDFDMNANALIDALRSVRDRL